ncbi:MAG: hypothetical protein QOJ19_2509 [Acidimicrobiia bacterium]|nr:hypothetical protein [Acidimicrobiia bacterium]
MRGLEKRYGRHEVLRGVDFDLHAGQIFALVGENGAGKSTVVRCVTGSEPADRGAVRVHGALPPGAASDRLFGVVWQDLALCDNLTVVANLFLGDESLGHLLLDERAMLAEAQQLFQRLKLPLSDLQRPVHMLSGGQRQLVPIARAVRRNPSVLFLDEPTASLGVTESAVVERLLNDLRDGGATILLVSHRLDQVFRLADRIAVLRGGRISAEVSPADTHPDDVVALISGVEADSTARRQLQRLHSLVDQLADVDPGASLPLIVSAMVEALATEQICVHLIEPDGRLRCSAAVGLDRRLLAAIDLLPLGDDGGPVGIAASTGRPVLVEDTRRDRRWAPIVDSALPRSSWSVPIVGSSGPLGTISGWADVIRRPPEDQLELVWLYASHAASAIERERLLADATRRNRVLETLRGVLDTLAGPQAAQRGMAVALLALCRGLGADAIALHHVGGDTVELTLTPLSQAESARATARQQEAAATLFRPAGRLDRARPVGHDVLAVPIAAPDGPAAVTAWWADPQRLTNDALDLLDDAGRSLRLALEREAFDRANAEAASLRRSQRLQRDFLSRLNHELRTPLTAIQGYASTLRQRT